MTERTLKYAHTGNLKKKQHNYLPDILTSASVKNIFKKVEKWLQGSQCSFYL